MPASYSSSLTTDLDWVRFLIGDTDISSPLLSDEEISALLAEESSTGKARKYFAAATALSTLYTSWSSGGKGITEIRVGSLDIKQGVDTSSSSAIESRIKALRDKGAYYSGSRKVLRALG